MPIFDLGCPECEYVERDRFFHVKPPENGFGVCHKCGLHLIPLLSAAVPLTKTFAEDRPYTDLHIRKDGKPQIITSWGQRNRLMKENGVEDPGVKRGTKGCWA